MLKSQRDPANTNQVVAQQSLGKSVFNLNTVLNKVSKWKFFASVISNISFIFFIALIAAQNLMFFT